MKIIFMGTPDFAGQALKDLLESRHQVLAVFTQPDRPRGRGKKVSFTPVKEIALEAGLPVYQPKKIRDPEIIEKIKELDPDIIVVAAYGRILPVDILNLPRHGAINIHASLLPKYRGAAPIHWALINGEEKTGVTIMQMDEGMDTGDMLLKKEIIIDQAANTGDLFNQLALLGGQALLEALDAIEKGQLEGEKQNEDEATYAPMLAKEDEILDWQMPASDLVNKIRGMNPWPGVYTFFRNQRLKIHKASLADSYQVQVLSNIEENSVRPGLIAGFGQEGILLATGQGFILLESLQPAGKKAMDHTDFINGYQVHEGEVLGK